MKLSSNYLRFFQFFQKNNNGHFDYIWDRIGRDLFDL